MAGADLRNYGFKRAMWRIGLYASFSREIPNQVRDDGKAKRAHSTFAILSTQKRLWKNVKTFFHSLFRLEIFRLFSETESCGLFFCVFSNFGHRYAADAPVVGVDFINDDNGGGTVFVKDVGQKICRTFD